MKILIQVPNYLPAIRYGGPVQSTHGLARGLVALGHSVQVITSNINGAELIPGDPGVQQNIDGVSVRYFPLAHPKRIYRSPAMRLGLREAMLDADILHLNGMFLWPGPKAAALARAANVPYVVAPRGMLAPELIAGKSALAKSIWLRLFDLEMLRGAAALHATSELEQRGIVQQNFNFAPVHIVPNGVDGPKVKPSLQEINALWAGVQEGRRVAFLARLDWKKGVDLAIEVVKNLEDVHLLIAGHDQIGLRAKLEREIAEANCSERIRFIGPLDGRRKWAFLAGADVLLVPSLNENFGNTVVESLAVGTAVLCTEGVGAGEIVRQLDPLAVLPRSIEAITDGLARLLQEPRRRSAYAQRAERLVLDKHSWLSIARRMESLFLSIIEARGLSSTDGQMRNRD